MPENCRYGNQVINLSRLLLNKYRSEVDDINLGLQHFFNDFDVVHARYISAGVRAMI